MKEPIARRISVPMNEQDLHNLELLRSSPEFRQSLPRDATSRAAIAHAVFKEDMRVVKERAVARVYEQMAQERSEVEARARNSKRISRHGRDKVAD